MEPFGKSPIPVLLLIFGKIALLFCWLFFIVKSFDIGTMMYDSKLTQWIGITVFGAGLLIVMLSFISLGESVSAGLPGEETKLKTKGIYRVSRNPL